MEGSSSLCVGWSTEWLGCLKAGECPLSDGTFAVVSDLGLREKLPGTLGIWLGLLQHYFHEKPSGAQLEGKGREPIETQGTTNQG